MTGLRLDFAIHYFERGFIGKYDEVDLIDYYHIRT